ncbi:hypothetical protein A3742_01155 [Oleiphilus sp. HI0071]|uniref:DUF2802 domain-containing protein n=1 Tax=unclassified Oleiphilus TaxID=2631174 RepID=UPI0007C28BA8
MSVLISFEYLALGSSAIAIISVAYGLYSASVTRKQVATLSDHINELGKELNAVNHSTLGMGRRLQSLVDKNEHLEKKLEEIQKNDPVKVSYSEAARLVKMGASIEELMSACSISRPEAELVSALTNQTTVQKTDSKKQDIPLLKTKA